MCDLPPVYINLPLTFSLLWSVISASLIQTGDTSKAEFVPLPSSLMCIYATVTAALLELFLGLFTAAQREHTVFHLHPIGTETTVNISELPEVSILKLCGTLSAFSGHNLAADFLRDLFLWPTLF